MQKNSSLANEFRLPKNRKSGLCYSYLAPIIASERKKITSTRDLSRAAHARTLSEFKQIISPNFPELLQKDQYRSLGEIHRLFQSNLSSCFFKIIRNSPEQDHDFLEIFLMKFEIQNIKTILRAKVLNLKSEQIKDDINFLVEEFLGRDELFKQALNAPRIEDVIRLFENSGSLYTPYLKNGYQQETKTKSLAFFDLFLDKAQIVRFWDEFDRLSWENQGLIKPFLLLFTEYYNLISIFRGKIWNFDQKTLEELIFPRYYQTNKVIIEQLISIKTIDELIFTITRKRFPHRIDFFDIPTKEKPTGTDVAHNIKKTFYKKAIQFINRNKGFRLNIVMPVSLFLEKKFEIQDLKMISTGIDYGLKPSSLVENSILLTR